MATPTYTLIDSTVLGSAASSVTFSSITQDYRDLMLIMQVGMTTASSYCNGVLNSDTGTNYFRVDMFGNGSTTDSNTRTSDDRLRFSVLADEHFSTANTNLVIAQFMDYSATDKHKTILIRRNTTEGDDPLVAAIAQRYASTSAITTIDLQAGSFAAGSTFYLYGIEA